MQFVSKRATYCLAYVQMLRYLLTIVSYAGIHAALVNVLRQFFVQLKMEEIS